MRLVPRDRRQTIVLLAVVVVARRRGRTAGLDADGSSVDGVATPSIGVMQRKLLRQRRGRQNGIRGTRLRFIMMVHTVCAFLKRDARRCDGSGSLAAAVIVK